MEPAAPIVVMAPREVPIGRLYGDGGARDTRRFLEEVKAAAATRRGEVSSGHILERRCARR